MQIEIDDAFLDKFIVDSLKRDYVRLQNDISYLLSKTSALLDHEKADLWNFKETAEGIATVLRYYMYRPDADAFIEENTP